MKYDLVVTHHTALCEYLRERGVIDATVPVLAHVSDPSVLDGKHVIGVLPISLSYRCASVTEPLSFLSSGDDWSVLLDMMLMDDRMVDTQVDLPSLDEEDWMRLIGYDRAQSRRE